MRTSASSPITSSPLESPPSPSSIRENYLGQIPILRNQKKLKKKKKVPVSVHIRLFSHLNRKPFQTLLSFLCEDSLIHGLGF